MSFEMKSLAASRVVKVILIEFGFCKVESGLGCLIRWILSILGTWLFNIVLKLFIASSRVSGSKK